MMDRLDQQIIEEVARTLAALKDEAIGDSPIERLFFRALRASAEFGISAIEHVLIPCADEPLEDLLRHRLRGRVIVVPQAQLERWRVDFLVYAWDTGSASGTERWRELIIECDGHDFHERTKEQAARDRERDRRAQLHGRIILRFTGSEIHADPLGCALQVARWAVRGWL